MPDLRVTHIAYNDGGRKLPNDQYQCTNAFQAWQRTPEYIAALDEATRRHLTDGESDTSILGFMTAHCEPRRSTPVQAPVVPARPVAPSVSSGPSWGLLAGVAVGLGALAGVAVWATSRARSNPHADVANEVMVVMAGGWVLVGTFLGWESDALGLENARLLKSWGTSRGLGQLVRSPTPQTEMSDTLEGSPRDSIPGMLYIPREEIVYTVDLDPNWRRILAT